MRVDNPHRIEERYKQLSVSNLGIRSYRDKVDEALELAQLVMEREPYFSHVQEILPHVKVVELVAPLNKGKPPISLSVLPRFKDSKNTTYTLDLDEEYIETTDTKIIADLIWNWLKEGFVQGKLLIKAK